MSDKKEDRHARLTESGQKLKKMNPLLDDRHIGWFENAYKQAFGENASVAYGQGYSGYSRKLKNQLIKVLEETSQRDLSTEITQVMKKINTGDAFSKDLAMLVLQPIGLAIEGSMHTLIGLVQLMSNIPAVLKKKDEGEMLLAMSRVWLGVSILLLAAVAPLARLYNAATRAYASVAFDKRQAQEFEDEWRVLDITCEEEAGFLDLYWASQGSAVAEATSQHKRSVSDLQSEYSKNDIEDDDTYTF